MKRFLELGRALIAFGTSQNFEPEFGHVLQARVKLTYDIIGE